MNVSLSRFSCMTRLWPHSHALDVELTASNFMAKYNHLVCYL